MPPEGHKVVTAAEMARIEKKSIEAGASGKAYMERAGAAVASVVAKYDPPHVTLLIGKGNNGGDAFVCGIALLQDGYSVTAYRLFQDASPLCAKYGALFAEAGGTVRDELAPFEPGVVVDGILGTGFVGSATGGVLKAIQEANRFNGPVIAIDIPSGVDATTGEVGSEAIEATETVTLGMAKIGLFIGEGMNHIGALCIADFGLDAAYIDEAKAVAYLVNEEAMGSLLPPLKRTRHKYEAGYVVACAGSPGMPGAAILSTYASLRAGAGIVRLFHPQGMEGELALTPPEVIKTPWDEKQFCKELERATSVLIGPGLGLHAEYIERAFEQIHVPTVIDADGLFLLKKRGSMPIVITPHRGEMTKLLGEEPTYELCQAFAEKNDITIVLKGAPTTIFHPHTVPLIMMRGDPGMATAGSGDVLAGIIAALLAQGLRNREAATLGAYLHGIAGEIAAHEMSSYDMIASDIIEALPDAFAQTMNRSE